MQKKQAQLQNQQAAEQEQKLKLKLARRVLGASFQRLCPQQAAVLSRSFDAGGAGGSNSASDNDAGAGPSPSPSPSHVPGNAGRQLERCESHSQIPKLPPLTDAYEPAGALDGPGASGTAASVDAAAAAGWDPADGAAAPRGAAPAGSLGSGRAVNVNVSGGNTLGAGSRRYPNPHALLSRSVSANRVGALQGAQQHYTVGAGFGGGSGGAGASRIQPSSQAQHQQRHGEQKHLRSRRRRSTLPNPLIKSVREGGGSDDDDGENDNGAAAAAAAGGDGGDGPDVAVSDRLGSRRDKALRPQPHHATVPQAPALAVAARSSSRLTAAAAGGLPPTPCGFALWRARARLPDGQRTFCIAGSGHHSAGIRAGLLARGWYENPERNSPFFDFKWAANPLDINHDTLWPGQIVNHFRHSTCLTTKHGLCYTVRDTAWYAAADAAAFYPRAYDITDEAFRREFLQDVRLTAAECLIKRALIDGAICITPQQQQQQHSLRRKSSSHSYNQQQQPQRGKASSPQASSAAADASGGEGATGDATSSSADQAAAANGVDGAGGAEGEGEEAAAAAGGGGRGGGGGVGGDLHRLRQRSDSTPLVDLPSLRLACRVVAARLRQQRHLRVVHGGGGGARSCAGGGGGGSCGGAARSGGGAAAGRSGGGGGGAREDPDKPPSGVELGAAQWQQLLKHRALSCSAPVLPPPQFDPAWITSRTFITSAMLPPQATSAAASSSPSASSPPAGAAQGGKSGGGGRRGHGAASATAVDAGAEGRRGGGGGAGTGTGTDGEGCGGSGSDGEGDSEGGSEGGARTSGSAPDLSAVEAAGEGEGCGAAKAAGGGPAAVADAAELLREVYGKSRRRHSAPLPCRRKGALAASTSSPAPAGLVTAVAAAAEEDATAAGGDLQAALSAPLALSSAPQAAAAEGSDFGGGDGGGGGASAGGERDDVGGCCDDADADVDASWLPQDLPPICYDDEALQALDPTSWRPAAEAILAALRAAAVQTHISGTNNIWIVKPAGKSRGRGIRLFNDPEPLLGYVRGQEAQGLEARWIAQKYVERPLIIERRKFDIRQWVLVTDWNPLQAWFYSTCYLRFAADDYDPNNLDVFQHLTNNSVSKYYEGPKKEDEITAAGNMWSIPRFQQWLAEVYGRDDIWEALLQPAMRHIAICTLKSAQDHITPRKGSCQLYGYDFLIDDQLRVWLLEVNSSPTMEPSTPITAELCADVQEDILKVVIDLPQQQAARRQARGGGGGGEAAANGSDPGVGSGPGSGAAAPAGGLDTGKWECIIDGGEELRQPQYTGLSLELKGTAIHAPPPRSNFAGRLYAATRQQQQQQQQPSAASPDDVPGSGSGGGGGAVDGNGRRSGVGPAAAVVTTAITPAPPPTPRVSAPASSSSSAPPAGAAGVTSQGDQWESQQPPPPSHPNHLLNGGQQHPVPYGVSGGGGGGADEPHSGVGSNGAAMVVARVYTGLTPPPSRGAGAGAGGAGRAVSPVRCRTPRISASPALTTHWDVGGFVLGSFGDPAAAITSFGSGGGGGGGTPAHPSPRTTTPRSDVAIASLSVGAAGGAPAPSSSLSLSASSGPPAPITLPATALWVPLPLSPSQSTLNSLTPTAMRMSLLARPGHNHGAAAAAAAPGPAPPGVRAR